MSKPERIKTSNLKAGLAVSIGFHILAGGLLSLWVMEFRPPPEREKVIRIKEIIIEKSKPEIKPPVKKEIKREFAKKPLNKNRLIQTPTRAKPFQPPRSALAKVISPRNVSLSQPPGRAVKRDFQQIDFYSAAVVEPREIFESPYEVKTASTISKSSEIVFRPRAAMPVNKFAAGPVQTANFPREAPRSISIIKVPQPIPEPAAFPEPKARKYSSNKNSRIVQASVKPVDALFKIAKKNPSVSRASFPENFKRTLVPQFKPAHVSTQAGASQKPEARTAPVARNSRFQFNPLPGVRLASYSPGLARLRNFTESLAQHGTSKKGSPGVERKEEQECESYRDGAFPATDSFGSSCLDEIRRGYVGTVRERIAVARYYPRLARRRGYEGEPVVRFTLGKNGDLIEASIEKPSGKSILDNAALETVLEAQPYPPIPLALGGTTMRFKLPVTFTLE